MSRQILLLFTTNFDNKGEDIMTIGIYIRVSTEEQAKEGYSIPAQKERLIAHCTSLGWTDYKFYIDEGVSAKDTNRPKLQDLLDDVKKGKISTVLVYRLDRFTRKVKDLYTLLETLSQYNCAFKSATEPYDTSSAMGKMFMGLVALIAEWETANLSERIKMALEEKVSSGERVGNIPYGFDLNDSEKLVQNEKEAPVILEMIDKLKSGMSVHALANYLTKVNDDRTTWHATAIYRILQNPALYGATRWNDKIYEDTHPEAAIVSKVEFGKLQLLLQDRGQHRMREVKTNYLFQGVLVCPQCGNHLAVNRYVRNRKDGTQYQGAVYKCQHCYKAGNTMLSIGEHRFLTALYEYMTNFKIDQFEPIEVPDETKKYKVQLKQIEKKREKFQRAWASDKITDEEFDKLMDETRGIYDSLKKKISESTTAAPTITKEELEEIVVSFNDNFRVLTDDEKREFVSRFIRKIEFELIPQPPKNYRNKKGKDLVRIIDIQFY
jgi:site-specific DNA recombinase